MPSTKEDNLHSNAAKIFSTEAKVLPVMSTKNICVSEALLALSSPIPSQLNFSNVHQTYLNYSKIEDIAA